MPEMWRIWKVITPREGLIGMTLFVIATSGMIHLVVMLGGSERYIGGLLGQ